MEGSSLDEEFNKLLKTQFTIIWISDNSIAHYNLLGIVYADRATYKFKGGFT